MSKYSKKLGAYDVHKQSLSFVRNGLMTLAFIGLLIQVIIDFSFENIVSNFIALTTTMLCCMVVFQPYNSTIGRAFIAAIVFLMVISNSLLPVFGTLMEGNSLIVNLIIPMETYFHRLIFAAVLLLAFVTSGSSISFIFRYGLSKISSLLGANLFFTPKAVWGIGIVSTFFTIIHYLPIPGGIAKILAGFNVTLYAPFIFLVPPYNKITTKWQKRALFFYYIVVAGISLAGNSRFGMVAPLAVIASTWLIAVLMGEVTVSKEIVRKFTIIFISGFFLLTQFIDLSTAILVARAGREERTMGEQLDVTFKYFLDKEALNDYKMYNVELMEDKGNAMETWHEDYINNPFLARFILIKFDDNCLYRINQFDQNQKDILIIDSYEKVLVLFPTPVLEMLKIKVDKNVINSYSMGDLINNLATGQPLGSFLVGSIFAHAYACYGWFYPVVLFFIYVLIFIILAGIVSVLNRDGYDVMKYSSLGLILPFYIFTIISVDGVNIPIGFLVRGAWQLLLIFWIIIWILRLTGIIGFPKNNFKKS